MDRLGGTDPGHRVGVGDTSRMTEGTDPWRVGKGRGTDFRAWGTRHREDSPPENRAEGTDGGAYTGPHRGQSPAQEWGEDRLQRGERRQGTTQGTDPWRAVREKTEETRQGRGGHRRTRGGQTPPEPWGEDRASESAWAGHDQRPHKEGDSWNPHGPGNAAPGLWG